MRSINISLASFPGKNHVSALLCAQNVVSREVGEPALGQLALEHTQIVPQNFGLLDDAMVNALKHHAPQTRFRLHANVRVLNKHCLVDLSNMREHMGWFAQAARISKALAAPVYTAHSGKRSDATLHELLDNARRCADLFECFVGVEGQYPTEAGDLMIATWSEYRQVFESGVPYVLDLSHINILAHQSGERNETLLTEMLACERCIEVHLSDNNGTGDWHQVCEIKPWWFDLLIHVHQGATVFTEGNHSRKRVFV